MRVKHIPRRLYLREADEWYPFEDWPGGGEILEFYLIYRGANTVYMTDDTKKARPSNTSSADLITVPTSSRMRLKGDPTQTLYFQSDAGTEYIEFIFTVIVEE